LKFLPLSLIVSLAKSGIETKEHPLRLFAIPITILFYVS